MRGYVPKSMSLFVCERENQIFNEFTGNNHAYLARSMVYLCNGSTKSSNVCRKKKLPNGSLICSLDPKNKPSDRKKSLGFLFRYV